MGNIDFTNEAGFSWYCVLLIGSGVAMLAISPLRRQTNVGKIANLIFGAGFCCYGFYLVFIFHGGTYIVFFKAFILPVVLIVNTVKSIATRRDATKAPQRRDRQEAAWAEEQAWYEQRREAKKTHADTSSREVEVPSGAQGS
jgi:hypothetical protein